MEPGAGGRRTSRIRFWLKYRAEWGQRLKVVGSHDNLGSWGLDGAPELKWSEGDMWHCMVDLPAGMSLPAPPSQQPVCTRIVSAMVHDACGHQVTHQECVLPTSAPLGQLRFTMHAQR